MNVPEMALRAIGSLCVVWTLLHVHRATSKEDYQPPRWILGTRAGEPVRLLERLEAIVLVIGFVMIGGQIVYLLVW